MREFLERKEMREVRNDFEKRGINRHFWVLTGGQDRIRYDLNGGMALTMVKTLFLMGIKIVVMPVEFES